jgi:hypothetical protein
MTIDALIALELGKYGASLDLAAMLVEHRRNVMIAWIWAKYRQRGVKNREQIETFCAYLNNEIEPKNLLSIQYRYEPIRRDNDPYYNAILVTLVRAYPVSELWRELLMFSWHLGLEMAMRIEIGEGVDPRDASVKFGVSYATAYRLARKMEREKMIEKFTPKNNEL